MFTLADLQKTPAKLAVKTQPQLVKKPSSSSSSDSDDDATAEVCFRSFFFPFFHHLEFVLHAFGIFELRLVKLSLMRL